MKTGLILIGDELLNGSRQDKHMAKAIQFLHQRGMSLAWVRMVGDEEERLVQTFKETLNSEDIVFSFGGIGATPDDITRPCIAKASGKPLFCHPEAKSLIEERYAEQAYPNRIKMADLPETSRIIPNPINKIPGFSLEHHHCLPGFPNMSWPMMEWVLDHYYSEFYSDADVDWRWYIFDTPESDLLPMMNELLATFKDVRLSSLPSTTNFSLIDFGLKGKSQAVTEAAQWLEHYLQTKRINYQALERT